jgi:hypothetical protein
MGFRKALGGYLSLTMLYRVGLLKEICVLSKNFISDIVGVFFRYVFVWLGIWLMPKI